MNKLLLVALAYVSTIYALDERCLNDEKFKKVPHKSDRQKYYICNGEVLVEHKCSEQLEFDKTQLECMSDRSGRSTITECQNDEIYSDTENNQQFYVCYNGQLQHQKCPQGMVFSLTKKYCEIGNTACGDVPHGGFTPSNQPNQYYVCANGKLQLQTCPAGETFSPNLGYCTTFRPIGPPIIRPPLPPPPPTNKLNCGAIKQGQFVADFADKTRYFVCVLGKLWSQTCPNQYVFSSTSLSCVHQPVTNSPNTNYCGPYEPGYRYKDCNNPNTVYFICVMGVFVVKQCPDGQILNSQWSCVNNGRSEPLASDEVMVSPNLSSQEYQRYCDQGYVLYEATKTCINPCDIKEDSLPKTTNFYVPDPNSLENYYRCIDESAGKRRSKGQAKVSEKLACPTGEQYFAALNIQDVPCMSRSALAQTCQSKSSKSAIAVVVNKKCKTSNLNPYYISCNNDSPSVERCPEGFVLYEGECLSTGYQCNSSFADIISQNHICICG